MCATAAATKTCVYCDEAGSTACAECTELVKAEKLGICMDCKTLWYTPDGIHCDCWEKEAKRQAEIFEDSGDYRDDDRYPAQSRAMARQADKHFETFNGGE